MYVIATFEHTIYLELAISAIEQKGIPRNQILAVPLDKRSEPGELFDTIHRSDGLSFFDSAAIVGTIFMLLGAIYGFELKWGPIIWGIIGAVSGIAVGFIIKYFYLKEKKFGVKNITSEVVLMIHCEERHWETIEKILWDNQALGLSRLNRSQTQNPSQTQSQSLTHSQ